MKSFLKIVVCVAAFFVGTPSTAAVQYSFSGFFSNNNSPSEIDFTGEFSFLVENYLVTELDISPSEMLSCHAGDQLCSTVHFFQDAQAAGLTVDFGVQAISVADSDGTMGYYYFARPAFSTLGSHTSLYGFNPGTLTVSSVPEPASWLSLLAGLGLLGTLVTRRRNSDA